MTNQIEVLLPYVRFRDALEMYSGLSIDVNVLERQISLLLNTLNNIQLSYLCYEIPSSLLVNADINAKSLMNSPKFPPYVLYATGTASCTSIRSCFNKTEHTNPTAPAVIVKI